MRTAAIISSSLLAIAVSGAPVDLPKLPVELPSLSLPLGSLPTGLPAIPVKPSQAFSATIPTGLPTGLPTIPKEPTAELPVENLPVRRADLSVVDEALEGLNIPELNLPTLPELPGTGDLNLPVKRADLPTLPVVDDLVKDVKVPSVPALPKLPTDAVKLPVRAELPVVNGIVESVKLPTDAVKLPTLPKLPVENVNLPVKRADVPAVNVPVNVAVDDIVELPDVQQPAVGVPTLPVDIPTVPEVGVPTLPKGARDIKQSLPVVGGADVPLDAGNIQVGTVDKYVDDLVKGAKVENIPSVPKVAREIGQTLPVVGGADVPLDAGKVQVGTVDKYVEEVVDGTTLKNVPVTEVVKGTTVKDLPNVGPRDIKQSIPVVGGVTVPLDAGKIQVGTVDKYIEDVVKGTTTGL
ncbi:hypothetical protein SLS59_007927 [Nothophoma quercina]|uniref:Uncharacterized protein n=1 Tax=Nothophoma quercina TaxID=749835 RepID=A0ABR3QVQ2_9PLEO